MQPYPFIDHHWHQIVPPASSPHHPQALSPFRYSEPRGRKPGRVKDAPVSKSNDPPGEDEHGLVALDRFATAFTPQWLRELPLPTSTYHLPRPIPFPSDDYALHVYPPPGMIRQQLNITPSILALPPHHDPSRPLNITQATADPVYYAVHFSRLLSLHLASQVEEANKAKVYSASVAIHTLAANTFRLHVPGVREDVPRLGLGDRLSLRGLYPNIWAPSQVAVEAAVVGLVKAQGFVYVWSPALAALNASLPKVNGMSQYQISFAVSAAPVLAMQDALRSMSIALGVHKCANNWLFPESVALPSTSQELEWVDQALNAAQKAAVAAIVRPSSIPYLVSGPPGTGKTKTLVEAVLQILKQREAVVLVVAPSSSAADTLARRLATSLKPNVLFRLNAPERTFAEVPADLLSYCVSLNERFDLPPFEQLMRYRVVVCTLLDSAILSSARATNLDIMRAQGNLYRSFALPAIAKPHWTHLLIDEAAQASEPETLIPLSVVLPVETSVPPVVVLCGDPNQLGPIISCPEARQGELDVSLLERLFQRDAYKQAHTATHLTQNYRSIAPILMVPSSMFYDDTLVPAATDVALLPWKELPNPDIPILFQGCETEEYWVDEGASWFNIGEIAASIKIVQSLLAGIPNLQQKEIAIMTPWREQVWRLRAALRKLKLGGVDVGNIETYQGGEFRVTILSCVRSKERFLAEDKRTNMGLFNERRRFNVAITRAKELLVVVGNANLLKGDPYWNGFLQIAHRNSLYRGPKVDLEMTGAYISKIESTLRNSRNTEDDGLFLAGELARATLMGE